MGEAERIEAISLQDVRVELQHFLDKPTTAKVWRSGVLVFDGVDHAALVAAETGGVRLPDPKGGCCCEPFSQSAGGVYTEHLAEYEPACPVHSEHVYNPRTGVWDLAVETGGLAEALEGCREQRGDLLALVEVEREATWAAGAEALREWCNVLADSVSHGTERGEPWVPWLVGIVKQGRARADALLVPDQQTSEGSERPSLHCAKGHCITNSTCSLHTQGARICDCPSLSDAAPEGGGTDG